MNNTIYLVDAYAHIYRCFHAVTPLTAKDGTPSNAIFGMARFLVTLEKEFSPNAGAFVFDKGKSVDRLKIAPDYKANRPPTPESMKPQIEPIREMIRAAGWHIIEKEGFEADDIIGTLANKFNNFNVKIISNDKDISQVISERVEMLITLPKIKGFYLRNAKKVKEKFGVSPTQIVDYLSMLGDSSDNIKGILGIGEVTASKLLQEHESIANMLANPHLIKNEKLREKISSNKELLERNIAMITLNTSIELDDSSIVEKLALKLPDVEYIIELTEKYSLKSLTNEFIKIFNKKTTPTLF